MNQPLTLGELAVRHGCELRGDPDVRVSRVASLDDAGPDSVSFLASSAWRDALARTRAAAVILRREDLPACPVAALVSNDPHLSFSRIAADLHPEPAAQPGVHPSAVVGTDCTVSASCEIAAGAVLGIGVRLGERVIVGPRSVLGAGAQVGDDTRIHPGVVIYPGVRIGARCIVHSGAVLGADGFGFARQRDGAWIKVPQVGGLVIGNDVEIGANTTIDRGAIGDTQIADGVKLDNQIQVGHNVKIGAHTAIASLTGVSGSTVIGARCMIGGQTGIAGHIRIADDVVLRGRSIVTGSIRHPGMYGGGGPPVDEIRRWRKNIVRFGQLDELARRLRAIEQRLVAQEGGEE